MRLTIDSTEALEDTLRVVGALYNVTLEVSPNGTKADGPGQETGNGAPASAGSTRGTRGSGRPRSGNRAPRKRAASKPARSKQARSGRARAGSSADARVSTPAVRSWARENGYTVADRGRVPAEVITAYRKAAPA